MVLLLSVLFCFVDITDFYELHHDIILGSGNSGEVILCSHIEVL